MSSLNGIEIRCAADVLVSGHGRLSFSYSWERLIVQVMPQDRFDAGKRVSAKVQGARGGRFQALGRVFAAQSHQAETRAIAHFRMWFGGQDLAEQLRGVGPGGVGPTQ